MTYKQDHIPKNTQNNRRPALTLSATTITIHNTGNPSSTAANERAWLTNKTNTRTASYHIVIDEKEAIEVLPLNEVGWHAGDGSGAKSGNRTSIGIEICESGNYSKTLDNAIELVVKMLKERGWGIDRLRRHFDWSGKQCPRLMNGDGKWTGWFEFLDRVEGNLKVNLVNHVNLVNSVNLVNIKVNNEMLDAKGLLIDNVTYVPLRAIGNAIGAEVKWNQSSNTASINNFT